MGVQAAVWPRRWRWARAAVGIPVVAVAVRTVVIRARWAVVNDRSRACTGCPARGPLAKGAAVVVAERRVVWMSSVAMIQAVRSWRISSAQWERRNAPVPGPAPARVDVGAGPVVFLGSDAGALHRLFHRGAPRRKADNRLNVSNNTQGMPIWVCAGPRAPWSRLWPQPCSR